MARWSKGNWVGSMYARVPAGVIASTDRAWRRGAALARRRLPVAWFEGPMAQTGEHGRVAVVAPQPSVMHFVQCIFGQAPEPTRTETTTWRRLSADVERLADEADLVLARLHAALGHRRLGGTCLRMPEAVGCRAELPAEGAVPRRAKRGQSGNLRTLRRSGMRWDVSHDTDAFVHFYQRMYVPFAEQRFGELAALRSLQRLRSHFLHGGLIRVWEGEAWVGGVVYSVEGQALRVWVVGVRDGDADLLERGVMTANWAFAFERAKQLGLTHCHMGLSRPTLHDGVLIYKKRWGAELLSRHPTYCDLFARWNTVNATVRRWLQVTPVLFRDGERFSGLSAVESNATCEAMERLAIDEAMPGLGRLCALAPGATAVQPCEMHDKRVRDLTVQALPEVASPRLVSLLRESATR